MKMDFSDLVLLVQLTFQYADEGAALLLDFDMPRVARWLSFALVVVLSTLVVHLSLAIQPIEVQQLFGDFAASPLRTVALQAFFLMASVLAIWQVGRLRGGVGHFDDALILVVWLQFVLLGMQLVQLALYAVLPMAANLLGFATLAWFFWLLTNFIAVLHRFTSL